MKRLILSTILGLLAFSATFGQDSKSYSDLTAEAKKLYQSKEYLKSAQKYSEAFKILGSKSMLADKYDAACSWTLANKPDSSFAQLFEMAQNRSYASLERISADTVLSSINQDTRWPGLIAIIKVNKEKAEVNFDRPLIATLDSIYQDDQKPRLRLHDIEKEYRWGSKEMNAICDTILAKDSINLSK